MKRFAIYIVAMLIAAAGFRHAPAAVHTDSSPSESAVKAYAAGLYERLGLHDVVNLAAFSQAMAGREKARGVKNRDLIVVIDFTKPSTDERMCVVDLAREKVLFRSHVAHGRNSGGNYATSFSNRPGSYKSSLGFYVTGKPYTGKNGYSLALDGLEKGINDKARERAIVIHGAPYCDPSFIGGAGRLGRSLGCPALPPAVSRRIIDTIKDGTLLYIYADDETYWQQSRFLMPV